MIEELLKDNIIRPLHESDILSKGGIVRRVNSEKDQQGMFMRYDDDGGMVLVNVVDMKNHAYAAEAGILKPEQGDDIYVYESYFGTDRSSADALKIIQEWALFKKHKDLETSILTFITSLYSPKQLLHYRKKQYLQSVFIPVQQKFQIGKYTPVEDNSRAWLDQLQYHIEQLDSGDHITYVAFIPPNTSSNPQYYSVGTKPHETTAEALKSEPFAFKPNHGGHIKCVGRGDNRYYLLDAGSNFLGKGHKTTLKTAEAVRKPLARLFPELTFKAVAGRDAFGQDQSF